MLNNNLYLGKLYSGVPIYVGLRIIISEFLLVFQIKYEHSEQYVTQDVE